MSDPLLPADQIEDTLEYHLARISHPGGPVYLTLIVLVAASLGALPLLRVEVSVRSPGIVRPVTEKHRVVARAAGVVEAVGVARGARVERGALLLTLRDAPLMARLAALAEERRQARAEERDLALLTRAGPPAPPERLATARYRRASAALADELGGLALREAQARRELERALALAERGLAPRSEVEEREFQLRQIGSERALAVERARGGWEAELADARARLRDLDTSASQAAADRALYRVEAPVSGTVVDMTSLLPGSFVQAGDELAVLSPAAGLVAEVYVSPRDIGLLRAGLPVRLQVDAFNYNDWGFLTGHVERLPEDVVVLDGKPVFRVPVALDRTHLRLRGGFRGELRKGMTVRARFVVARRSLWQLLHDRVSDWLDPRGGELSAIGRLIADSLPRVVFLHCAGIRAG
jgi:HlyD family secretion protein